MQYQVWSVLNDDGCTFPIDLLKTFDSKEEAVKFAKQCRKTVDIMCVSSISKYWLSGWQSNV